MGLTPGTQICVARVAPLGGPVELSFRGSKLALGKGVASKVFIDVEKQIVNQ
jgi:Fe2+ transport system protein FeoA